MYSMHCASTERLLVAGVLRMRACPLAGWGESH